MRARKIKDNEKAKERSRVLEALLMLCTEVMLKDWPARSLAPQNLNPIWRNLDFVYDTLVKLDRSSPLSRAWYLLWDSFRQAHINYKWEGWPRYSSDALEAFPSDAEILLSAGARSELDWWTNDNERRSLGKVRTLQVEAVRFFLEDARQLLRRSLTANPGESETRLRLAHVLLELDERDEAMKLLTSYEWPPDEAAFEYFARLFEGDLQAKRGDVTSALLVLRSRHRAGYGVAVRAPGESAAPVFPGTPARRGGSVERGHDRWQTATRPVVAVHHGERLADAGISEGRALDGDAMKSLAALVSTALICCAGHAAVAQQQPFSSRVAAVRVDTLVTDGGRPVTDFTARDFELRDNGVVQSITDLQFGTLPLNVVSVFDASASLGGTPLEHLKRAYTGLVDALAGDDRMALITFTNGVKLRTTLTADLAKLRGLAGDLTAAGTTSLFEALFASLSLREADPGRYLLLVMSDGEDSSSWLTARQVVDAVKLTRSRDLSRNHSNASRNGDRGQGDRRFPARCLSGGSYTFALTQDEASSHH